MSFANIRATTIVPLAVYCFVLGGLFLFLATYVIWSTKAGVSHIGFSPRFLVGVFIFLMGGFIAIGIGLFKENRLCWNILFSVLMISFSCMASFTFIFIVFLIINIKGIVPYFQYIQSTSVAWVSFFMFFLSTGIVLCYLTGDEVVFYLGVRRQGLSPF